MGLLREIVRPGLESRCDDVLPRRTQLCSTTKNVCRRTRADRQDLAGCAIFETVRVSVPRLVLLSQSRRFLTNLCQVANHLAPAIPERVVGICVERPLERAHPVF